MQGEKLLEFFPAALPIRLRKSNHMPLNEVDKAWIRQEIQVAHKRKGLGKLTGFIKDWSGAGAAVAILILAFTQWTAYTEFKATTTYRLQNIEQWNTSFDSRLTKMEYSIHLSQLAIDPTKTENAEQAKTLLEAAQSKNIPLDIDLVRNVGDRFFQAAKGNTRLWDASLSFLEYRSSVNRTAVPPYGTPSHSSLPTPKLTFGWSKNNQEGRFHQVIGVEIAGAETDTAHSARFENLDNPQPAGTGRQWIVVTLSDPMSLDGLLMKNIIFFCSPGGDLGYGGGPLVLENVYFVGCKFTGIQLTPRGRELSNRLLASVPTSFTWKETNLASGM